MESKMEVIDDLDIDTSLITFAENELGFDLYDWQAGVIEAFDHASEHLVQVSLATPNGSGKSSIVIPALTFGWLSMYSRGRVVCTSADSKQVDNQIMPALEAHRSRFPAWKFIERQIDTPTGGRFFAFTCTEPGRAEGFHKGDDIDAPLLFIVDEAKTVDDAIFSAIDRCTYNAILLASSPGKMSGRFYDSQFKEGLKWDRFRVGLKDCKHIDQEKIDRIIAQHGPNSPFTRSALHGEFIELFDGDPVYYAYNQQYHEASELGWPHGAILVVGMDVGTHNASTIAAYKMDKKGRPHLWVMREVVLPEKGKSGSDTDRQCVELLKVLANEFPFWNTGSEVCPQTIFFCDPAARNSAFTSRGNNASALKVIHSHGIFPGMKTAVHLQPSIAVVNRLLQQNFHNINGEVVWQFRIDKNRCPDLCSGMRAKYRYPVFGEAGWGLDLPLKGSLCDNIDHVCLVAGTLIKTNRGEIPIEEVTTSDMAMTRSGWRSVVASAQTGDNEELWEMTAGSHRIIGTKDHPVWIEGHGFNELESCRQGDRVLVCDTISNSMESLTPETPKPKTSGEGNTSPTATSPSIVPFGNPSTGRYPEGITSTIKTRTPSTTIHPISNYSPPLDISSCIGPIGSPRLKRKSVSIAENHSKAPVSIRSIIALTLARQRPASLPERTTSPSPALIAVSRYTETNTNSVSGYADPAKTSAEPWKRNHPLIGAQDHASNAAKSLLRTSYQARQPSSVPKSARCATGLILESTTSLGSASYAEPNSPSTSTKHRRTALVHAVRKLDGRGAVYNLTIEGAHEYYANGILVSNCDALRYLIINALDLAPEEHIAAMATKKEGGTFKEPKRRV